MGAPEIPGAGEGGYGGPEAAGRPFYEPYGSPAAPPTNPWQPSSVETQPGYAGGVAAHPKEPSAAQPQPGYPGTAEPPPVPTASPFFEPTPPAPRPKSRFSLATLVVSVVLSLIAGTIAGAAAGSLARPARTTAVSIPQAGPVALPEGASISDLVRTIEPGVAAIHVFSGSQRGAGTGFLIDTQGHIVTNRHVVEGGRDYRINLAGKKDLRAQLVGADPELDIAVLKIDPFPEMRPLALGDSEGLRVGDTVVAVGNALDLPGGPTVTMGIVSALNRSISDETPDGRRRVALTGLIQTDAAINPGNSGGPLLNLAGQVVGVNTAVAANPNDLTGSQQAQNIGFAININEAKAAAENIINGVVSRRAILGVDVVTVTPVVAERRGLQVEEGALIADLMEGGPADQAGLKIDDVIVGIDGKNVASAEELRAALRPKKPGDEVEVAFVRGKDRQTVRVKLIEAP
jgi:putative serine protease PepD